CPPAPPRTSWRSAGSTSWTSWSSCGTRPRRRCTRAPRSARRSRTTGRSRPDARAHAEGQGPVRGRGLVPRAGRAGGAHVAGARSARDGHAHDGPDRDRGAEGGLYIFTHGRRRAPGGHERNLRGALRDHGLRAARAFFFEAAGGEDAFQAYGDAVCAELAAAAVPAGDGGGLAVFGHAVFLNAIAYKVAQAAGARPTTREGGAARHGPGGDAGHPRVDERGRGEVPARVSL
ncbi:unnamed protein product, partial [Pelagomonas calceolata]